MTRLAHKRGRPSNYRRSLNSEYWRQVCIAVRVRDHHQCQKCGKTHSLEVHHKTYTVEGKSIVGREKEYLGSLVTLCGECHQAEHSD